MKRSFTAMIRLRAIALATIAFASCAEQHEPQQPDTVPHKWEVHLQYALKNGANNERQLALKGYEYRGKVKSEAEKRQLADEIFADDAYTITYNGRDYANPIMETLGAMKSRIDGFGEKLRADIESDIVVGRTDVIDLEWRFNGKTYHSVAIADPNGESIYDNIGTYATAKTESFSQERVIKEGKTMEDSENSYHAKYETHEFFSDTTRLARSELFVNGYSYLENSGILTNWIMETRPPRQKDAPPARPKPIDRTGIDAF